MSMRCIGPSMFFFYSMTPFLPVIAIMSLCMFSVAKLSKVCKVYNGSCKQRSAL